MQLLSKKLSYPRVSRPVYVEPPGFPPGYSEHRRRLKLGIGQVCAEGEKCPFCRPYLVYINLEDR